MNDKITLELSKLEAIYFFAELSRIWPVGAAYITINAYEVIVSDYQPFILKQLYEITQRLNISTLYKGTMQTPDSLMSWHGEDTGGDNLCSMESDYFQWFKDRVRGRKLSKS